MLRKHLRDAAADSIILPAPASGDSIVRAALTAVAHDDRDEDVQRARERAWRQL